MPPDDETLQELALYIYHEFDARIPCTECGKRDQKGICIGEECPHMTEEQIFNRLKDFFQKQGTSKTGMEH